MRRLAALPLLAGLAACAPTPPAGEAPAAKANAALHAFTFFVGDVEARDPRITDFIQADCGVVALARVPGIPLGDALLRPDLVVQYDENDAVVHRWGKSYSSEILAIAGDQLFFGASPGGDAGPFRTSPAGDVTVAVPLAANLEANSSVIPCPAALPGFPDMALVTCYETTDMAGRKLRLAWEAGCP